MYRFQPCSVQPCRLFEPCRTRVKPACLPCPNKCLIPICVRNRKNVGAALAAISAVSRPRPLLQRAMVNRIYIANWNYAPAGETLRHDCCRFIQNADRLTSGGRSNARSSRYIPGERLFTPFSRPTPWKSFIHAGLQACTELEQQQSLGSLTGEAARTGRGSEQARRFQAATASASVRRLGPVAWQSRHTTAHA